MQIILLRGVYVVRFLATIPIYEMGDVQGQFDKRLLTLVRGMGN